MNTYIGIDLGTSGVKLLLVDTEGEVLSEHTETYPVFYPQPSYSEQNPVDWYNAVIRGIDELLVGQNRKDVKGISFGGQMHGLVMLDAKDEVIRPAILWNDGRSVKEVEYLNTVVGKAKLTKLTGNIAFAGFTAPKIMWVRDNEPQNFRRTKKIMLPKDYLAYRLSGVFGTDYSDASGMLLLDVKHKCYSKEMLEIVSITEDMLPKLFESYDVIGTVKAEIADHLGLSRDVKVIMGAGDNAAAAIGTGCVRDGSCNISLGTSGTLFVSTDKFSCDSKLAIHSFDHANGKYHLMGCILSAASCNKWWVEDVLGSSHNKEQEDIEKYIGSNNVYFLPYLMGERCPHNDVYATGAFIGLRANTSRSQMTLAVLEGVAFALKDCLEIARSKGVDIRKATLCGGGAKSKIWAQIIADVLDVKLEFVKTEQGPSYGGAILAMVGCGEYSNVEEACAKIVEVTSSVEPQEDKVDAYAKKYVIYKEIYQDLKQTFRKMAE